MWRRLTAIMRSLIKSASDPDPLTREENEAPRRRGDDQAERTAEAIKEWDIQRGCAAVEQIDLPFLLRRIARSARQDAIRMAAAMRLDDAQLIREVALAAKDISLRWQGARHLDDPLLLSDVALFKQTDDRFEALRAQAHQALCKHLDNLQWKGAVHRLKSYLFAVDYTPFKVEAFVRLPATEIQSEVLHHMAGQDFRYLSESLMKHLFVRVQSAGWHAIRSRRAEQCQYCHGRGRLALGYESMEDGATLPAHALPCPECQSSGNLAFDEVTCLRNGHPPIRFRLLQPDT